MIGRCLLILGALIAVGIVGIFLLYVAALSLLTIIALVIGLLATLVLGYWAGSNSLDHPATSAAPPVISSPDRVTLVSGVSIASSGLPRYGSAEQLRQARL